MPRVNLDYSNAYLLSFVGDEVVQLGKCPIVKAPFVLNMLVLFAASHLGGLSNVAEVFQHNGRAKGSILYNALAQQMVAIPVEALLPFAQLLQVALSRLRSVGLQFSPETERATVDLFPMTIAKKLTSAGHSRTVQSQVYPDHLLAFFNDWFRNIDHDMQPPCAFAITKVSSTGRTAVVFGIVNRNRKGDTLFASTGRETNGVAFPVERVCMQVVADSTGEAVRTGDGLELWC